MEIWKKDPLRAKIKPYNLIDQEVIDLFSFAGNERILELGCEDGNRAAIFATRLPKATVHAVDKCHHTIDHALATHQKIANLSFATIDFTAFAFPKGFEIIFSFSPLLHIHNMQNFFEQIYAALKPNGWAILRFPIGISPKLEKVFASETWQQEEKKQKIELFHHTRDEIEEALIPISWQEFFLTPFESLRTFQKEHELTHYLLGEKLIKQDLEESERHSLAKEIATSLFKEDQVFTLKTPFLHLECQK